MKITSAGISGVVANPMALSTKSEPLDAKAHTARQSLKSSAKESANESGAGIDDRVSERLVERALLGEVDAYQRLVERYEAKLLSLAFGIMRNREDARDIVQEAFLKAFRNLSSFKGQSSFYTWIYRVTYNVAIDEKRKRFRHVETLVGEEREFSEAPQLQSGTALTEHKAQSGEFRKSFELALAELSPEHRAVIVLRELEGLSYEEISEVTKVNKGTVMSRLHHARKKLQAALGEFRPEGQTAEEESED
ncbi:sigma-70 family RNA polymerase sigma factor [bacterium]|nr:sigma-70 family RNA polymerase sigma factor [bacterium]